MSARVRLTDEDGEVLGDLPECSIDELVEKNEADESVCRRLRGLAVGESIRFGGGPMDPIINVERVT
jgi:hypothetical protein